MFALSAHWNQGRIPVVAVGGGRVAAAQAVVDTCMADGPRIPWMVFPGSRIEKTKDGEQLREEPEHSTVIEVAKKAMEIYGSDLIQIQWADDARMDDSSETPGGALTHKK